MPHAAILFLMVALGGAVGSVLRHGVNVWIGAPVATLAVNIAGCFIMGLLAGYGAFVAQLPEHWRVFLMVGVLGGLTTFSAFSLDFLTLMERGQLALAAGYVLGSVFLSLLAVFAGLGLVKALA